MDGAGGAGFAFLTKLGFWDRVGGKQEKDRTGGNDQAFGKRGSLREERRERRITGCRSYLAAMGYGPVTGFGGIT